MYAYSSQVIDLLGGIKTIGELAEMGVPRLTTLDLSDMAAAFGAVEQLLLSELPDLQDFPAPIIVHITDGEYNGSDPAPIIRRIMGMRTIDGNVLVANISHESDLIDSQSSDIHTWQGFHQPEELQTACGERMFHMSSIIPDSYLGVVREFGYSISSGSRMLLPASAHELVELILPVSGATPVTRSH